MLRNLLIVLLLALSLEAEAASPVFVRIGVTPVILHDDHAAMQAFRQYLEKSTGWTVELVPRGSYRQTIDMLKRGELDFAWVSAFPYVYLRHHFNVRMVAMPLFNGSPTFRAYLIVPAEDQSTTSVLQLHDRVFAYADPYSHTGYVVPRYEILQAGKDARSFFARTFFTSGHKNVIRAVASGLADGGSVDSFVWDSLARVAPELTGRTRVAWQSSDFGSPPVVAGLNTKSQTIDILRKSLTEMAADPTGVAALRRMRMDGFVAGDPKVFREVEAMMRATGDL